MSTTPNQPIIVAFVADLFFTSRIHKVAQHLGYQVEWIENPDAFTHEGDETPSKERPGESVTGPLHHLMDQLTQWQPALLIFDLSHEDVPWREWLPRLKSSPATRRLPVLAFAAHIDTQTIQDARAYGADKVVARSRFSSGLVDLVQEVAKNSDADAVTATCAEPLSALAQQGIDAFNAGAYYDAHEHLEHAWQADESAGRELYRAILQVAVAYYQLQRGNYRGAIKMFLRARQWLAPFPDQCRHINVAQCRQNADAVYQLVTDLGPDRLDQFDWTIILPIEVTV